MYHGGNYTRGAYRVGVALLLASRNASGNIWVLGSARPLICASREASNEQA
jgi:hypothetical protein